MYFTSLYTAYSSLSSMIHVLCFAEVYDFLSQLLRFMVHAQMARTGHVILVLLRAHPSPKIRWEERVCAGLYTSVGRDKRVK